MRKFKQKINLVRSRTANKLREQQADYYEDWQRRHEEAMQECECKEPDFGDYLRDPELYG